MALETLSDVDKIGRHKICFEHFGIAFTEGADDFKEIYDEFIFVDSNQNAIAFVIQDGPVKDVGVNGCEVDTMIDTAKILIEGFNNHSPCRENSDAILHLNAALNALDRRKRNRERRGVEGENKL